MIASGGFGFVLLLLYFGGAASLDDPRFTPAGMAPLFAFLLLEFGMHVSSGLATRVRAMERLSEEEFQRRAARSADLARSRILEAVGFGATGLVGLLIAILEGSSSIRLAWAGFSIVFLAGGLRFVGPRGYYQVQLEIWNAKPRLPKWVKPAAYLIPGIVLLALAIASG